MAPFHADGNPFWRAPYRRPHSFGQGEFGELEAPAASCPCGCEARQSRACETTGRKFADPVRRESGPVSAACPVETPPRGSAPMRAVSDVGGIPFRWVCRVRVQAQKGHSYGGGVLVSPCHVLTAAHVIYFPQEPLGSRTIQVWPGYRPESKTVFDANGWAVDSHWNVSDCMTYGSDLAIIRLSKPVGGDIRFWDIVPFEPADLSGKPCVVAGYPCKPDDLDSTRIFRSEGSIAGGIVISSCTNGRPAYNNHPEEKGTVQGRLFRTITSATQLLAHDADSHSSMSGGPVCVLDHGAPKLVAIHVGTVKDGCLKKAVLLTAPIQTQIQDWVHRTLRPL